MKEHKTLSDKAIKLRLSALHKAMDTEDKRHEREKASFAYRRSVIQKHCPHTKITYHPDPSGNSDSSHSCDLCDMEV